ncbi:hypothetical protein [Kribbella flavida]|nr:hypothetical protein [Kribbella flavida]
MMISVDDSFADLAVVRLTGVLTLATAPRVCETLTQCIAEQPAAVIADLRFAQVEHPQLLNVFSVVARRAALWSGVQLVLVSGAALQGRLRFPARALSRFVRIYPTMTIARSATRRAPLRRLAAKILPPTELSAHTARTYVADVCSTWGCAPLAPEAALIAADLVHTAAQHCTHDLVLRLELRQDLLTVALTSDAEAPLPRVTDLTHASGSSTTRNADHITWTVLRAPG